jgi:hypothetical protein
VIEIESILFCNPPCPDEEQTWNDRNDLFDVYVPGGGSREVWVARKLVGSPGSPIGFADHKYRITPRVDNSQRVLRCDHTFATPAPQVADFTYYNHYYLDSLTGPQDE